MVDNCSGRVRHIVFGDTAQELIQFFAGGYAEKVEAGDQLGALEDDYRLRFPKKFHCTDGHDVRSLSEQSIDEWFSSNHVYHEYERLTNLPERLIPDFTLYSRSQQPVFVEYWGMLGDPVYENRRLKKCQIYAKYQCALIELYYSDIQNLDFSLRSKLTRYNISIGK